jgi:hypothetical protein
MFGKFTASAALLVLSISPALADSSQCVNPYPPAALNGAKATMQQMKDARQDVQTFIAASDDYQKCMGDDLDAQVKAAAKEKDPKPLDPSIKADVDAKIDANQHMKEKVGAEFNAAVQAYKAAHPGG